MTVGVVGAGLAGLMVAAELERKGTDTVVLESSSDVGGVAASIHGDGFTLEPGVGSFLRPDRSLDHYLSEFELAVAPIEGSSARFVGTRKGFVKFPTGPVSVASSPLLSTAGKLRAAGEFSVTSVSEAESVRDFFVRRFGPEAGTLAAHLAASGVFAGDPDALSMAAAFPRAVDMEHASGSIIKAMIDRRRSAEDSGGAKAMFVPEVSMAAFAGRLARSLRVHTGFSVSSLVPHGTGWRITGREDLDVEQVVLATGTSAAAAVAPPILGPLLARRPQVPVAVIGLGSRASMHLPDGFGALTHPQDDLVSRGLLFESCYAPHRAPHGGSLVKVIAGGANHREAVTWTDDYLVRVVGAEVASMLQQPLEADWVNVVRRSIPQYNLGHERWLETLDDVVGALPGLHLTGWGYRGVGLGHVAADALRVVAAVQGE